MKILIYIIILAGISFSCKKDGQKQPETGHISVRGWSVLSDLPEQFEKTIQQARYYKINHLQLSHDLIMDLRQVKNPDEQRKISRLIDKAHQAGIEEVTVWDHALYPLDYYPDRFKTGPDSTIDLDNPDFWIWFKQDYRDMMNLIPNVDGLILTFVETGARAERQYSEQLSTKAEKLAVVINHVADIVIGELGKKLYIRTFAYSDSEYRVTVGCLEHLKYDNIILMMKETPHDFFLTHPNDKFAGTINRPTIIEFDTGNEFNGQGVIANTWPEYVLKRWRDFLSRKHIIGYVARTDRYGTTTAINRPSEILLYALKRCTEDTTITAELIYDEFITSRYGADALPWLKPAFKSAFDIVTSSMYTLGTNTSNHSGLDFDPYPSSYARHVSGKWIDPPVVFVKHNVNKEFHYWKDLIEHIAPARFKALGGQLEDEAVYVLENKWVTPEERMDEEFLEYLITEKEYGVGKAQAALRYVEKAQAYMVADQYKDVYHTFYRTLLTARLYEAVTKAYFGYRIYARGESFRTQSLINIIRQGLDDILLLVNDMEQYKEPYPIGQWDWKKDAATAKSYYDKILTGGWPEYGGIIFRDSNKQ
jgi:hypothetical protein